MMLDVAIVGAGPAGLTAGIFARRAGLNVTCFEKLVHGGQASLTYKINNYPGFAEIMGPDLADKICAHAKDLGVAVEYTNIKKIKKLKTKFVLETDNQKFEAKKVIIACGCKIRRLGLPNEEALTGRGISYCASCDGNFYKNKTVAVVGGGNTAIDDVHYLHKIAKKIYLINRRSEFRAGEFALEGIKKYKNVEIITPAQIAEFKETDGHLTGITINHGGVQKDIKLDGVFLAIGSYPDLQFVNFELETDSAGYIVVDSEMKTSVPNVFACGDIISKNFRQIITACAEGAIAGNACITFQDGK